MYCGTPAFAGLVGMCSMNVESGSCSYIAGISLDKVGHRYWGHIWVKWDTESTTFCSGQNVIL